MQGAVIIGDCLVDEIHTDGQSPMRFAGGAGLNLAAGVARLGLPATLVTRVGQDRDGFYLLGYARERSIRVINTPTVDPTGVAVSTRKNGEPSYLFSPSMFRRRISFPPRVLETIARADAVVVNSYPLDNSEHASALVAALSCASGLCIADPNPRPRLISSIDAFRRGFEMLLKAVDLVKLSDEDAYLLYQLDWRSTSTRLFNLGVDTLLFSHGAEGATIVDRTGLCVQVPAASRPEPIVDTMGAGDATLASLVASYLRGGPPNSEEVWRRYLSNAMAVAAATCRHAGAELVPA
ncbi:Fructokinase [Ensifer adhaerens]|uniref:PfkB family carbohydrate kinase n=1 Tax=Ensifer adhaerens TaxID=106592 RepID=UPI001567C6ED|nr:PfkB family carbohydrate kinase [Ensifer adhaerens]NRP21761.1 Fructokinase [Ensifer adhaerens]